MDQPFAVEANIVEYGPHVFFGNKYDHFERAYTNF